MSIKRRLCSAGACVLLLALSLSAIVTVQAAPEKEREALIIIDPGHGGRDPGAIGFSGIHEKEITLAFARELAALIDKEYGMRAELTRTEDIYISLRDRLAWARQHKADILLSVHADAEPSKRAIGASVYMLSRQGASSEAARLLAERENQESQVGEADIQDADDEVASMLIDLSQTASLNHSRALSNEILRALKPFAKAKHVEGGNFVVLKIADAASALIELGYLSNQADEIRLRSPAYRGQIAAAVLSGVKSYFRLYATSDLLLSKEYVEDYVVQRGDTLSSVSKRFAVPISQIKRLSGIDSDNLTVGQRLKILLPRP